MNKILIIEDDEAIAEIEKDYLENCGYEADIVYDGETGLKIGLDGNYSLILLDLMLPKMDGFTVCRRLREKLDIPILMVTARQEDIDKIKGLGLGADDYIEKPFSPAVLVARVKANLAQSERMINVDLVFDRETLYEKIWGMEALGDNATVAVHINRLREKLEKNPSKPRYIQTVWGAGYRFKA